MRVVFIIHAFILLVAIAVTAATLLFVIKSRAESWDGETNSAVTVVESK